MVLVETKPGVSGQKCLLILKWHQLHTFQEDGFLTCIYIMVSNIFNLLVAENHRIALLGLVGVTKEAEGKTENVQKRQTNSENY